MRGYIDPTMLAQYQYKKSEPLLSRKTRRLLLSLGIDRLRQSNISMGRECRKKLALSDKDPVFGVNMLLGSVSHLAVEDVDQLKAMHKDPWFWEQHFARVRDMYPDQKYRMPDGNLLTIGDVRAFCNKFTDHSWLRGQTLGELLIKTMEGIASMGFTVVKSEFNMRFTDGDGKYSVEFTGTLDLGVRDIIGRYGILDLKMYGLLSSFTTGKLVVKAQNPSPVEIAYNPQLRHYHWLHSKVCPGENVEFYGLVTPANLIPYTKGANKGQYRGDLVHMNDVRHDAYVRMWEDDLINWLDSFALSQTRDMPTNFGKIQCPTCPFFKHCLGDANADAFTGDEFGYLYEETD